MNPITEEKRQALIAKCNAAIKSLAPIQGAADGWIKCSERMPEVGKEVILFNGLVRSGYYYTEYGDFSDVTEDVFTIGDATHWMPLPPPPEASNEQ